MNALIADMRNCKEAQLQLRTGGSTVFPTAAAASQH